MKVRKEHILLICILFTGIIARIIKFGDPGIVMDTVVFSRLGKNLIEFGRYSFGENYNMGVFFPPGYPLIIGIINVFADNLFFSAKLVSVVSSCITIILSYAVGKELYNEEAGLFASFIYALYPVILIISVDAYSDSLFFCFLLVSLYIFILSLRKDDLHVHALLGVSIAITFLVRPEGLFLLLLPGLRLFGLFDKRIYFDKKYYLKLALIISLFVLIVSPYMIFIKNYTGKFSISGKANVSIMLGELSGDMEYHDIVNAPDNLYDRSAFVMNEDKTQLRGWNRKTNLSLKEYLLKDPTALMEKYQKNLLRQTSTLIKLLLPIMLPLFFSFFRRDLFNNRIRLIFIIYPFLFFLMYPLFIIIEKQTLIIVLFLIFISSGGYSNSRTVISNILNYYSIKKSKVLFLLEKNIKPLIIILLVLSSLSYLRYSSFENTERLIEHEKAGNYLIENISSSYEELNIMGRKPYVSFYSDSRFTMLPYANGLDVVNFAKLYDVDYIVVDERSLSKWDFYEELKELHRYSDEVELFYEDKSYKLVKLFRIKK